MSEYPQIAVNESPPLVVEVSEQQHGPVVVEAPQPASVVEVLIPGPAGPEGPEGPAGMPGEGGDKTFTYRQATASDTWGPIAHGLGKRPATTVFDDLGNEVGTAPYHENANICWIYLGFPMSGEATFN